MLTVFTIAVLTRQLFLGLPNAVLSLEILRLYSAQIANLAAANCADMIGLELKCGRGVITNVMLQLQVFFSV